jgi:release factor glutamine methyltransferase
MRQALRRPNAPLPTKAWLLPRLGQTADEAVTERLETLLSRRLDHEPSAYITGEREFHALRFEVTPDVLIPRPETELLVGKVIDWVSGAGGHFTTYPPTPQSLAFLENKPRKTDAMRIVDVGTGSGAIAVALAKSLPAATIIGTDVSWAALDVARRNARRHGVERRIDFRHGDLMTPIDCYVDLIVANLPYVREADWRDLAPEVRDYEPRLALAAGDDGLDLIRSLLHQAPRYLRPGGALCLEFGIGQEEALGASVDRMMPGATVKIFEDFAGIPRVAVVCT